MGNLRQKIAFEHLKIIYAKMPIEENSKDYNELIEILSNAKCYYLNNKIFDFYEMSIISNYILSNKILCDEKDFIESLLDN